MLISVVTPSFRSSKWLKLCIPSVADQGVEHEHIVQDSCSEDGTGDWLPSDSRVAAFIEKDRGMYDAVNRGFRRSRGDILCYINCDEQYLPGALRRVIDFFEQHPNVDVLFGDCIVTDPNGNYLCERRALPPQSLHTQVALNLSFLTAGLFIRRQFLERNQLYFDPGFRDLGDIEWTLRMLKAKARMATLGEFTTVFAETGANMNLGANAAREKAEFFARAPRSARALAPAIVAHYRLRRMLAGHYRCSPHQYAIYTHDSPAVRRVFNADHPTYRWVRWTAPAA